jgi:hypothetical protein
MSDVGIDILRGIFKLGLVVARGIERLWETHCRWMPAGWVWNFKNHKFLSDHLRGVRNYEGDYLERDEFPQYVIGDLDVFSTEPISRGDAVDYLRQWGLDRSCFRPEQRHLLSPNIANLKQIVVGNQRGFEAELYVYVS